MECTGEEWKAIGEAKKGEQEDLKNLRRVNAEGTPQQPINPSQVNTVETLQQGDGPIPDLRTTAEGKQDFAINTDINERGEWRTVVYRKQKFKRQYSKPPWISCTDQMQEQIAKSSHSELWNLKKKKIKKIHYQSEPLIITQFNEVKN